MTIQRNLNKSGFGGNWVMWWLKETLKDAGWTVLKSGSGTGGIYEASGEVFKATDNPQKSSDCTDIGVGSGSEHFGYAGCWFTMADPDGNREFVFRRHTSASDTYDAYWYVGYSKAAGYSGGTPNANTPPDATDEEDVSVSGNKTTPGNLHVGGGNANLVHVAADDVASPLGEYGFFCIELEATNATSAVLFLDDIRNAATGDTSALVLAHDNAILTEANISAPGGLGYTFADDGGGSEAWATTTYFWSTSTGNAYQLEGGVSKYDSKERTIPIPVVEMTVGGYLGTSRWLNIPGVARGYPETGDSQAHLYFNDVIAIDFWDGASTPATV